MAERVIETLCAQGIPVRSLPVSLARDWPGAQILDLVLAIATGCDAVEGMFGQDGPSGTRAREGWRVATLIATDMRAMQALGMPANTALDLLTYWQTHDPYFLDQEPLK